MSRSLQDFPTALSELHKLEFDYAGGDGIDFEPYSEFLSPAETISWFKAWTGNPDADSSCFKVFGQDGGGGYAAFWMVHPERPTLDQPIVFLGSEGETGVIASDFSHYLWLLASGFGPCEAIADPDQSRPKIEHFRAFAQRWSSTEELEGRVVLQQARELFPHFLNDK